MPIYVLFCSLLDSFMFYLYTSVYSISPLYRILQTPMKVDMQNALLIIHFIHKSLSNSNFHRDYVIRLPERYIAGGGARPYLHISLRQSCHVHFTSTITTVLAILLDSLLTNFHVWRLHLIQPKSLTSTSSKSRKK